MGQLDGVRTPMGFHPASQLLQNIQQSLGTMAKKKSSPNQDKGLGGNAGKGSAGKDRVVYSEFSTARPEALARGVADSPPAQQALKVQVSRKGRGGKTVTVISGFQHRPETLVALAKTLKAQCGTGGTAKDDTIEIQGDHGDKLLELLQKRGYNAKRSGG